MLYEYVRSAMGLLETGEEKLSQTRELQMGKLIIGASDTVTSQFLLPYLDSFHKQHPAIHIQIVSGRSHKVLGLLRSGKVDIAFASTPHRYLLAGHPSPASAPTPSSWLGRSIPAISTMCTPWRRSPLFPLILLERKASSRLFWSAISCKRPAAEPRDRAGARSLLVDLAAIGFGVAGVTEEFVHRELESGRLKKLKTDFDIPARSVDMCLLNDVPQSAAAERFTAFCEGQLIEAISGNHSSR